MALSFFVSGIGVPVLDVRFQVSGVRCQGGITLGLTIEKNGKVENQDTKNRGLKIM